MYGLAMTITYGARIDKRFYVARTKGVLRAIIDEQERFADHNGWLINWRMRDNTGWCEAKYDDFKRQLNFETTGKGVRVHVCW